MVGRMTSLSSMAQKDGSGENPSPTDNETRTISSGQGGGVSRIIMVCREFFDSLVSPLGYEDENGFHYGAERE
jgi:hypothetical protein